MNDIFQQALQLHGDGQFAEAEDAYLRAVTVDPMIVDAWNNLSALAMQRNDPATAEKRVRRALLIEPSNESARYNLGIILLAKARDALKKNAAQDARMLLRELLGNDPDNDEARLLMLQTLRSGDFAAELMDLGIPLAPRDLSRSLLITSFPRCGASYIRAALLRISDCRLTNPMLRSASMAQDFHIPALVRAATKNVLIQQRVLAAHENLVYMQALSLRTIVMVRNLFDVIASFADVDDPGVYGVPIDVARWAALSRNHRIDVAIDWVVPFCIEFYMGWERVQREQNLSICWIQYDDLLNDRATTLERVCQYLGFNVTYYSLAVKVAELEGEPGATNANRRESGRGAKILSRDQRQRIRVMVERVPGVDFSPILPA